MAGKSDIKIKEVLLSVDNILLDPQNPRFATKSQSYKISDFKDKNVQLEMIKKLETYKIKELIDSIKKNGFLSLERVVVVRLEQGSNKYVVVEGNRRIAAIKLILVDETIDSELKNSLMEISVCVILGKVYEDSQEERYKIASLAHLSGKVEWGDYQKAIFLHHIVTQYGKKCKEVGAEVGLGRNQAIAIFQACEAYLSIQRLEWYQESEEEHCTDEDYFPLFYEAMRSGSIKHDYFKVPNKFTNNIVCNRENLMNFCQWIGIIDHQNFTDRQIKYRKQVKDLETVLKHPIAKQGLEEGKSLEEAIRLVHQEKINHKKIISDFLSYLEKISEDDLKDISDSDRKKLKKIEQEIQKILNKKSKR